VKPTFQYANAKKKPVSASIATEKTLMLTKNPLRSSGLAFKQRVYASPKNAHV
jgi:hypothetical protein